MVNVADRWRERNVWCQERSCQQVEAEYETCSNDKNGIKKIEDKNTVHQTEFSNC